MWKPEEIEKLQNAILEFNNLETHYGDLPRDVRGVVDVCQALFMRLEKLKREGDEGEEPPEKNNKLGDALHMLAVFADNGILDNVLSPDNTDQLSGLLGNLSKVSKAEAGLRKKDAALFLKNSGDTDILIAKQDEIDELANKKDG